MKLYNVMMTRVSAMLKSCVTTKKNICICAIFIVTAICMFVTCTSSRHSSDQSAKQLSCPTFDLPAHPSQIIFGDLNWQIPLGDDYRTELANGIIAYVAVDSSLPLINIEVYIRSGSLNDRDDVAGASALLTRMLRSGGTQEFAPDSLDALIEHYAMRFSFSQGESFLQVNAAFLAEHLDNAMFVLEEMLFRPRFDERRLERERGIMIDNIRHRFVNPAPALGAAYRKHRFPQSAASRLSTEETLRNISRGDLQALHNWAFTSGEAEVILAVSGMFDRDEMIERLNTTLFHNYPKMRDMFFSERTLPEFYPPINTTPQLRGLVVHRDINQAFIRMGLPLFTRPHEDYFNVLVMNYILGGSGFLSRLGARVRSDEGLTYSIHSRAESNYIYDGTLFIDFSTSVGSYPRAVSIILEEIEKFVEDGITEIELENARAALIAELPSSFRSPNDIVSTYAWNEFFRRAPDHYVRYVDILQSLTTESVNAAARKYLDAGNITYTIVADTAAINAIAQNAKNDDGLDGHFHITNLEDVRIVTTDSIAALP